MQNSTGRSFVKSVPVFDIASSKWSVLCPILSFIRDSDLGCRYLQNTTGEIPPALARSCSVVAAAPDSSSFNIYIYGGYDGGDANQQPSDVVYVLSVPAFKWIKAYEGKGNHGRYGHKCFRTYPDKMFVLGGQYTSAATCVDGGIIQVFNLNSLKFQDAYDPEDWEEYKVPAPISAQIGGQ